MTLTRGLSRRFLVALVAAAVTALVAAQTVARVLIRGAVLRSSLPLLVELYKSYVAPACADGASPPGLPRGFTLHAYDDLTLRPAGSAPPFPFAAPPPPGASFIEPLRRDGSGLVFRLAEPGRCALVHLQWEPTPERGTVYTGLLAAVLFVTLVAGGLGVLTVIRPLLRRIEALRIAAEGVGDPGAYAPLGGAGDDELSAVAASLDRAHARIVAGARDLEERQQALQRSLADVAHDLRTPLASLQLTLEALDPAEGEASLRAGVARAFRDVVYLVGLTNNLHLASQLRDGWSPAAEGAAVDLVDTVARVVERARVLARREGVSIEGATPDGPLFVQADATAVEQALTNVVENAVYHGVAGGHVAVVLEREQEGAFSLSVTDDGPGVDGADLPRLGDRTFRTDFARQRDRRGRGLGLAIAHEICARAGWSLRFEAAQPHGLRVVFRGARRDDFVPAQISPAAG